MAPVAVFDVDGVLVDTHDIVRRAYARVGVDLPDHIWGSSWRIWLPEQCGGDLDRARILHDRKTQAHIELLSGTAVQTLAGAHAAETLALRGWTVRFLTGSTWDIAQRTLDSVRPSWSEWLSGTDMDSTGKRKKLSEISREGGVYVDDNKSLGVSVTEESRWRLVHFQGQPVAELLDEIGE